MATTTSENKTTETVPEEIISLRDYFKDNIRILSSIGQFSYILKIRADQYDVSLTLQLDKSYPSKAPEIIITAPRLTPDQIILVQELLQSYSETLRNKPMILAIYSRLFQWFDENNIQTLSATSNNPSAPAVLPPRSPTNGKMTTIPFTSVNTNNSNNKKSTDEHDGEQSKKASMKTADDVISRIEWDDRLDKRYFRVGYLDRFVGLQEKPFDDFDFKIDLSTVSDRHTNILAIPKHRIQYFKYENEIIWDKETRTDFMFGSTGSPVTIYDIVQRHQNLIDDDNDKHEQPLPQIESEDNSLPTTSPPPRYLTLTDGQSKPNYYLSIPITDPTLIARSMVYRQHLLDSVSFSSLMTFEPEHFHITLVTLRLDTSAQIERHIIALKRIQEELRYHCSYPDQLRLEFVGIDMFYGKTLFLKCRSNSRLDRLRTLIIERLCEQYKDEQNTLFAGNYYEFIPHLTLLKSKRKLSSLTNINDEEFGTQTVDTLQLRPIGTTTCSNSIGEEEKSGRCVFQLDLS